MNIQRYRPRRFEKENKIIKEKLKKETKLFYEKYRPKMRKIQRL